MEAEGDSEKAMQLFEEALDVYKETSSISPNAAAVYENISALKVAQGLRGEEAIAASASALKIRRRTKGDEDADTKLRMTTHRSLLRLLLESRS
ncbi:unnamed protein product [Cylindrotheca closterium]|uniref:Uncharacterized protein n=1 Tax=Cylindrotheca closterium TaxID=2856 RepID=A0AAD2G2L6_9STRA|nr:unnamed protein product [Cylindrotheca closterium]CAJ1960268.1 unnamed protein product [Cylindrotheca closterium]